MPYFLDTMETIPEGVGFAYFGGLYFSWVIAFALLAAACCFVYKKSGEKRRKMLRHGFAAFVLCNELFKMVCLFIGGTWLPKYLPLHMCSLNIFLVTWHAVKPSKLLDNYLYTVGIPTAAIALVFPAWNTLPAGNFMYWHSYTIHMALAIYPLMVTVGGDIKPHPKNLWKCLALAAGMAIPVYFINLALGTNFMFLMWAEPGNPLLWFEQNWGNHLLGMPVLGVAMLGLMYLCALPVWWKKKQNTSVSKEASR